ncbi:unnamed protein product, partial [Scytosiphon promiscuus]
MKLVGCDPFTRAYYRREHGIDMDSSLDDVTAAESLGQHRGGGTAGAFPADRYGGRRIRCKAALRSNMPIDKGREFVITYDLALDTLMVHELQRRNSGRPGGLFLVKGRHRHPERNNRYYVPQDLFLGAEIPLVTGHTLVVTEMDRSSLALCEEHPEEFPLMDGRRVLGRVAQRARNMPLSLTPSELRCRAGEALGTTTPSRASPPKGKGNVRSGAWGNCAAPSSAIPATNFTPGWTAGKVLTAGGSHVGGMNLGITRSPGQAGTNRGATGAQQPTTGGEKGTDHASGVATGRHSYHATGAERALGTGIGNSADGSDHGTSDAGNSGNSTRMISSGNFHDDDNRVERRVAIENPGKYYGYGFDPQNVRGVGNPKNESATAPWAAVQPAGVNVFASDAGHTAHMAKGASMRNTADMEGGSNDTIGSNGSGGKKCCLSFDGHEAFRDAMDDLGLLTGLGQQEVLTLVRAFTDKPGKRILWASMCDRISQFEATSAAKITARQGHVVGAGNTVGGVRPAGTRELAVGDTTELLRRMRQTGVAWRAVFARVRQESRRDSSSRSLLGVASLVQAMRRNKLQVGAGDAQFLARRFSRGGGSQVDFHALCDAVYPCDFSSPPSSLPPSLPDTIGENAFQQASAAERHALEGAPGHSRCASLSPRSPLIGVGRGWAGQTEGACFAGHPEARAPSCDYDIGSGNVHGGGSAGGGCGTEEGGWSLWDRQRQRQPNGHQHHPEQQEL